MSKPLTAGHNPPTSLQYWKDYLNHSALNAGQAARDVRYLTKESLKHRIPSLATNLKFTVLPPQWHHAPEDLTGMGKATAKQWFMAGYDEMTE